MKKTFLSAILLSFALAAAGCSSSSDTSTSSAKNDSSVEVSVVSESNESKESTVKGTETDTTEDQVVPLFNFEPIKTALQDQNFSLKDENYKDAAMTLTAEGEDGTFDVRAEKFETAEDAEKSYAQAISELENDSYQLVNAYSTDITDLTILINDVNNVYALVGVDKESTDVYILQDILEGAEPTVLNAMKSLGFNIGDAE